MALSTKKGYWVATALLRSARFELDSGHLTRAAELARLSEEAALQATSHVVTIQARGLLAEVLRDLGDMQGALSAVDRALSSADHPEVTARLRAEILWAKGTLLRRVGRVVEALDAYADAIAVFQQVGARRMEARAKSSLAFALFALGRYEDGILLAQQAMHIDSAIGGRFQTAKTLANMGLCYAGAGDFDTALQYLKQAREAHERYGERDSRADTLLSAAEVLIERGDLAEASVLVGDAGALVRLTESRYDSIHERLLLALLARARGEHQAAVARAFEARQGAEAQAYAAFHFYAMALEAISRVEAGEHHTGVLLATTALGAIETIQGSEYSLSTRALCVEALEKSSSPQAPAMRRQSAKFAQERADAIRDPNLWRAFLDRPSVVFLLGRRGEPASLESHGRLFP
jgi:tetratricopeptide (TPR) repeat protein